MEIVSQNNGSNLDQIQLNGQIIDMTEWIGRKAIREALDAELPGGVKVETILFCLITFPILLEIHTKNPTNVQILLRKLESAWLALQANQEIKLRLESFLPVINQIRTQYPWYFAVVPSYLLVEFGRIANKFRSKQ